MLNFRGRADEENSEHLSNPWQKIVGPAKDEPENETEHAAWVRKYLDLADLLITRVQRRLESTPLRRGRARRHAA